MLVLCLQSKLIGISPPHEISNYDKYDYTNEPIIVCYLVLLYISILVTERMCCHQNTCMREKRYVV